MTDCERLSDRMPAVARGQARWAPDEIRHFNKCGPCREEWELLQVVTRLGENAAASLDPSAIATGVLRRLATEPKTVRPPRRAWSFAALTAAAAVVAAVWAGSLQTGPSAVQQSGTALTGRLSIPLPELESLEPAELDSVLQTMDETVVSGSPVEDPALGDLNNDELERVLTSWEG